jgi:DNA-binding beta-propeller fold protein YncE
MATAVLVAAGALAASACGGPAGTGTGSGSPSAASHSGATLAPTSLAVSATAPAAPDVVNATPASSASATPSSSTPIAYLALNDGTLESLNLQPVGLGSPIPLDHAPAALAIAPSGTTAYVADADASAVTVVDLGNGTVESQIALPAGSGPLTAIAITPSGSTVYVTTGQTVGSTGLLIPITVATGRVGSPISVGPDPTGIAITPDGQTAYVVDNGSTTITPVHLANGMTGTPIQVGIGPVAVAISPTGDAAYVLGAGVDDTLTPVKLATDPTEDQVGSPIPAGSGVPQTVAIAPDGSSAFVADIDDALQIGLPSGTTLWSSGNAAYSSVAVSPDGTVAVFAYASSDFGAAGLTVVDVSTGAGGAVALDADPIAIAFAAS